MSTKKKLLEAAAGNAGEAVYVDDVFSTYLYTGNGGSQTITNGVDLAGEGGLTWIKSRTNAGFHFLFDTERGAEKALSSELTDAEISRSGSLTAFNNNGFSVGSFAASNGSGQNYASWTFRKQPGFFDVVTYTGDGTSSRTIAHNLGSVPGMVIVKRTDSTSNWTVWHRSVTGNGFLETNDAWQSSYTRITAPDSTVFTVSDSTMVNASDGTYVAYLFAHDAQDFGTDSDESIIKCGSISTDGVGQFTDVDLGFEPQWVLVKRTDGTGDWWMYDTMRGIGAPAVSQNALRANLSNAESTTATIAINSSGLVAYDNYHLDPNSTYIYVAIRRPHKPASEFAATDLFGMAAQAPAVSGSTGGWNAGFVTDMALKFEEALANHDINSRLTGTEVLYTDATNIGSASAISKWDYQEGFGTSSATYSPHKKALFRRAPGFFDVVNPNSTSYKPATHTHNHNLGVPPELIIAKCRDFVQEWYVGVQADQTGDNFYQLYLDSNAAGSVSNSTFKWGDQTASTFYSTLYGTSLGYIHYLFASVPGISKVGSYTGTGNDLNVDCGFSSGARFVLVKRTDSTGDWYVWNYLFGIVAGNDPYSLLNTSAAPVTNTDYIDPLSSGFTITSSAPAALNASGGTYLFLAIA